MEWQLIYDKSWKMFMANDGIVKHSMFDIARPLLLNSSYRPLKLFNVK